MYFWIIYNYLYNLQLCLTYKEMKLMDNKILLNLLNLLTLSLNKKSFSDHAIRTSGPHLWNSLPEILKYSKTVKQFVQNLK